MVANVKDLAPMSGSLPSDVQQLASTIAVVLAQQLQPVALRVDNLDNRVGLLEEQFLYEDLTRSQQREMQRIAGELAYSFSATDGKTAKQHYANIYGGLKDKYSVPRYTDIPRCKFLEAMAILRQYDGTSKHYWLQH